MLSVKQAALRACVSPSLIYAWIADGSLPHLRVGRRKGSRGKILIAPEDLDEVLAAFKVLGRPVSAPASSDSPAGPFSELDRKRLARAWKTG